MKTLFSGRYERRTNVETLWHDNGTRIIVPAGELVEIVKLHQIPEADRGAITAGIGQYKKQGRDFVPIKIRDWFAMIESKLLKQGD